MRAATRDNTRNAFGAEAASHVRYLLFAETADREKFPNVARLLRALAFAEKVHASSHYRQSRELLGEFSVHFTAPFIYERTVDNLEKAYRSEVQESEEVYLPYSTVAAMQGERHMAQNFEWMARVENGHSTLVRRALEQVRRDAGDPPLGDFHVCDVCGHTIEGEVPEECAVCKAKKSRFRLVE